MEKRILRKGTGNTVALVASEFRHVFVHLGGAVMALDADEATDFANALLDGAGVVRGHELDEVLPGSRLGRAA